MVTGILSVTFLAIGVWMFINHADQYIHPVKKPQGVRRASTAAALTPAAGLPAALSAKGPAPAVEAGLLPWRLTAPISRSVALARANGTIDIFGGLTRSGRSAPGIYSLDTSTGRLTHIGNLAVPLHDAAGAALGNRYFLFGGGSPNTVATVEAVGLSAARTGKVVGRLPRRRSDGWAVTIGDAIYVVGGYSGSSLSPKDGSVLVTADGARFSHVVDLPIPVRYPAVAAVGGLIYVFGGIGIGGDPISDIQVVNPQKSSARLAGKMPIPLEGAAAAVVGNRIYIAGGATTEAVAARAGDKSAAKVAAASSSHFVTVGTIWSFNPSGGHLKVAGRLPIPIANSAVAVVNKRVWLLGGEYQGRAMASVQMFTPNRGFGIAGEAGAGSPYFGGRLLVADRGNNRLLLLDSSGNIVWRYPNASSSAPSSGFYFPDDAFFEQGGRSIISNQEQNNTIVKIAFPSGKLLWSYGHPGKAGAAPGYLHEPDDAYVLPDGTVAVADAYNCRILFIGPNGKPSGQIGENGVCRHNPPKSLGEPNGATPLANGDILISEIRGSWISEYTRSGKLVWDVQLPIAYPSDPQQIGPDRYLVADYTKPGAIIEFNRAGTILYRYQPRSGPGMLDHPSLVELLPSGAFMVNDDYNDRMVAIDPHTGALVWQYGIEGKPGTAPGQLSKPDGFDLLMKNGSTPTHL